jgi:alpha-tubulin suppressor-like RCC1 family protein
MSTYIQSTGVSSATSLIALSNSVIALRSDGLVFGCGSSPEGALGEGALFARSTYVQAAGISNVIAIANNGSILGVHALRADGLVFGVGYNQQGGIGDGTTLNRSTYVQVLGLSQIVAIGGGFALRSDGKLFATGFNLYGQLGNNSTIDGTSFAAVF